MLRKPGNSGGGMKTLLIPDIRPPGLAKQEAVRLLSTS